MEWYSKESPWDPLREPNIREAPVEKSLSVAETEVRTAKSSSCSGASKRKRVYYKSPEKVKCSVDGCIFDLRNCREYHRRHRVCQLHSKTSSVLVKGQEQRFCQQCSTFQSLDEFDGLKRSCRRRLEGHNKRRRKPRPPPLRFPADYTGPRILQFGSPTADDPFVSMWAAQPESYNNRYPPILPKLEQQSLVGRPLSNLQNMQEKEVNGNEGMSLYVHNQSVSPLTAGGGNGNGSQKVPWDSALYLLSALEAQSCSEFSMVQSSLDCPIQSRPPLEHFQFDDGTQKCSCYRSVTSGPRLTLDAINTTNFHHNGMLQMGTEPIENGGSSLTFPFFWE